MMPEDIRDVFGAALLDLQYGDSPVGVRRFGEGPPSKVRSALREIDRSELE